VCEGWLPVAVTRTTVDAADKKVEKFPRGGALSAPLSRAVVVGIATLERPWFRSEVAGVVGLDRFVGHLVRGGGRCVNSVG
jgi:hypothetical protein